MHVSAVSHVFLYNFSGAVGVFALLTSAGTPNIAITAPCIGLCRRYASRNRSNIRTITETPHKTSTFFFISRGADSLDLFSLSFAATVSLGAWPAKFFSHPEQTQRTCERR